MIPMTSLPLPKLPKTMVLYLEQGPPALIFMYQCRYCIMYKENKTCALVDGDINPTAWCVLWLPLLGGV